MAKTKVQEKKAETQGETKKQRRKLARQEARITFKLERARKGVRRTKKRITKVLLNLEADEKFVLKLEQKLAQLHQGQPEAASADVIEQPEATSVESNGQFEAAPQEIRLLPVEDFAGSEVAQNEQATPATDEETYFVVETDENVAIITSDELADSEEVASINEEHATTTPDEETVAPEVKQELAEPVAEEAIFTTVEEGSVPVGEETVVPEAKQEEVSPEEAVPTTVEEGSVPVVEETVETPVAKEEEKEEDSSELRQEEPIGHPQN